MPDAAAPIHPTSARERYGRYLLVAGVGAVLATGVILLDDRDPVVFAIPLLVLTALVLVVLRLSDDRGEDRSLDRAAGELGLRHAGPAPLPPITPVLAAVRGERVVHTLTGELAEGGPPCRLARVRVGAADLAVCLTDLPGSRSGLADPHGLTGLEAPAAELDTATADRLVTHPLRPGVATGDDALVVFAAAPRRSPAPFGELLAVARDVQARLASRG